MRLASLATMLAAVAVAQPQKAKDLNDIGLKAMERGDFAAGQRAMLEALQIWQSLGPEFEPHTAIQLMNLGDALCGQDNWKEGAKLFERALELSRHSMGPKDLRTVSNMNRLANALLVQGQTERAEPLYRDALAIERELYPNEIQTAHTLAGLGSMHSRAGRTEEGLREAEEGLAITLKAAGEDNSETGLAYANVAQIHRNAGHLDRSLPLLRKARAILERTLGPTHPRVASVISQEGLALMAENKLTLAGQDLMRAVDLLTRTRASSVELAGAEYNLGLLRMRQKKYPEADDLLSKALTLEEQYSSEPGSEMSATLEMLSQVREKEHRPDEAAQLKARATSISTSYR